ncbi:penicillin-binding protein 2 [Actinoplanes sp. TFC3]|uniref:peptidoglycan D,D-transpeptidase FtsI family protein n=1 Tax=Actinoplanes sp. TFC3 TaxID=1710355 RepID=UPI0009EC839B|nr:penicillin-binding protein 2 [Actinoplanes sp. TFC3]
MTPRNDEPPRRGEPRRGASLEDQHPGGGERGFGGIGDARAYTPRGRTVRESDQRTRSPRAGRTGDPFRPALQVLDGGRPVRDRRRDEDLHRDEDRRRDADDSDPPPQRRGRDDDRRRAGDGSKGRDDDRRGSADGRRGRDDGRGRSDDRRGRSREDTARRDDGRRAKSDDGRRAKSEERREPARTRATAGAARIRTTANPRRSAAPNRGDAPVRKAMPARQPVTARQAAQGRTAAPARDPRRRQPDTRVRRPVIPPEAPKLANSTRRLRLGTVLALTLFVTIGVRLVALQVMDSPAQAASLLEQRNKRLTEIVLPAPRGSILDRNGSVLAHSVEARYIYADPEMVDNPQQVAAQLSPLLGVPQSNLMQLLAKKKRPGGGESHFEYLARGVEPSTADTIKKLNLTGIGSRRDERRDVPGADLAANLIGFTGEDRTGLEGVEARYDDVLRGTDGKRVYETGQGDLAKEIPGGYNRETKAAPGSSIELTIDTYLQFEVQKYLTSYMQEVNATVAGAIVLDVKTGEVLAQASYPTYNAQKAFDSKPNERDDAVSSIITDPGSTHKAFTIGAALQEGVITPDSVVTVGKGLMLGDRPFSDTHGFANGTKLTVAQVLAYSSNIGTIRIAQKLGKEKLYEYQQKFGLGRATNEGMPGEAPGKLLEPSQWSGSAYGAVPIGHSVDATLLQMAAGYAAIANDGVYIQPHLIKATISGRTGKSTPPAAPETHRVLSPQVATELRTMMEAVVDAKGATGTKAKVEGYRVSGKTGTGKMLVDGQYTSHNAGSFIGMAPAENPRFVVGVFADVPNGTGGDVAAPAFSKMMASALRQYYVPPSGTPAPKFDWKD